LIDLIWFKRLYLCCKCCDNFLLCCRLLLYSTRRRL